MTPYAGLAAAALLVKKIGLDRAIDERVRLLNFRLPYAESDHVLTHVYNLFVGGSCIQDIEALQHSEAAKTILGAERIPDPTTAGDFLRRFARRDLASGQAAVDDRRVKVWKKMPSEMRRRATVDIDSLIKEVYGACKEGADFSYTKKWSYHPMAITLAETGECLRLINRPGNSPSEAGAVEALREAFDLTCGAFKRVYMRGDSKFCRGEIVALCEAPQYSVRFAVVKEGSPKVRKLAEELPETAWKPYVARPEKRERPPGTKRRKKRPRRRRRIAARRGYRNLATIREWLAEVPYSLTTCAGTFRLVIRRQLIEERNGQQALFLRYEYRFILSNIPQREMTPAEVVRFAYGRCDQENALEQAKNGLNGFRMPTGTLMANGAFLLCAQIAWCLRAWMSLIALPKETSRWEWKRFRHAFVYIAGKVVRAAGEVVVRISAAHRWAEGLIRATEKLRRMPFL